MKYFKFKFILLITPILIILLLISINKEIYDRYYSAVLHYKISRDIKEKNLEIIEGLNNWMLENYITAGMNEEYLPILDKNSMNRLIDGYSVCDGSAHTYLQIAIFLDIKGYTIPLYDNDLITSKHTVTLLTPYEKKEQSIEALSEEAIVIDPVLNLVFKNNKNYASLKNICNQNFDQSQKNKLKIIIPQYFGFYSDHNEFLSLFCNIKQKWMRNVPKSELSIPLKTLVYFLDILPNNLLLGIHKLFINFYFKDDFLKARNLELFGNFKDAKKYYKKIIQSNSKLHYDIFRGAAKDQNYQSKKNKIIKTEIRDFAKFYLNILEYKENKVIMDNPFSISNKPFYKLYESYFEKMKKQIF